MFTNKRIIVAPLYWGLGHATRCVPIINNLIQNNTVAIASDGEALVLLQQEFPQLDSFELPPYNIRYTFDSMIANMIIQGPGSLMTIKKEQKKANEIAKSWQADVIISDNRFGFRSDHTQNIYITHQLNIPSNNRFLSNIASRIHQRIISKFDECWVPDFKGGKNLAGKLSQVNINTPTRYLGPISRMKKIEPSIIYDYTAVLSGPEPQRTKIEEIILQVFSQFPELKFCLVRGTKSGDENRVDRAHISVFDLLGSEALNNVMAASSHMICRAGYTSIMDLIQLEKPATIIPTPGQYEQEYLAERLNGKYNFNTCTQKELKTHLTKLFSKG